MIFMRTEPVTSTADTEVDAVDFGKLRVAIVHHWFVDPWGGSERVVEVIARMFPNADLFTLMVEPRVLPPDLKRRKIHTTFLQRIPGKYRFRRHLFPLYALALEQLDLTGYDLVISSESGPAKGVITSPHTCHICYCNSPMRYIWEMYHEYKRGLSGSIASAAFALAAHRMRIWDLASSFRVDYFVANSRNVAGRIHKHYRRDAVVIPCPSRMSCVGIADTFDDHYLVLGRLVDYKRVDLAIAACNRLGRKLKIVGDGPQMSALRKLAGPTIEFAGAVDDEAVAHAYARCRALLFCGEEDFGLVPVEAQSFGRPVVAFAKGGALETVAGLNVGSDFLAGSTGVFFSQQTPESLVAAIQYFESVEPRFSPTAIRAHAEQFDESHFVETFSRFIREKLVDFQASSPRAMISQPALMSS
jgi:glycosyltransferase involved in cell wall biosynthesis